MTPLVQLDRQDKVARLRLNRPEARNALSIELVAALGRALDELRDWTEGYVCVVEGEGRAFCAGMDLKAVQSDPEAMGGLLHDLADVLLKLRTLPMVTIARVQRAAIGGGCGLATVCDFLVTHADAKLGYPEVNLGVCPGVVAPWLVRKIGAGATRSLLLRGNLLSGSEAHGLGLASHVAATLEDLEGEVQALVDEVRAAGLGALRETKDWMNELDGSLDEALAQRGAAISARVIQTEEAQARLREVLGA
ncbi:MAG: enoyl-CoA hydratase/isomerase family protein [Phycisphaerales bacterium JB038]